MIVHVVGNLCFDTTLTVPRFPEPGETLVALNSRTGLGGKGINQAVAAARAGASVICHAAIGAADLETVTRTLAGEDRLTLSPSAFAMPSDTSTILVRPDGENLIVSVTACARALDALAGGPLAEVASPGDLVLMQGNLAPGPTFACLAGARRRGACTMFNPSPMWPDASPDWNMIDWLVLNAGELVRLTRDPDPRRGAARLLDRGVGAAAVTLGARGALLVTRDQCCSVSAPPVVALDSTGAGDVFCGVLAALLTSRVEPGEALARATAAASFSVTRLGALDGCPTAGDLATLPPLAVNRSPP